MSPAAMMFTVFIACSLFIILLSVWWNGIQRKRLMADQVIDEHVKKVARNKKKKSRQSQH